VVIYSGKGVVFLTAVKVRDTVSREAALVFTEQKEFTAHHRSLSPAPLALQRAAREAACGASGWLVCSR